MNEEHANMGATKGIEQSFVIRSEEELDLTKPDFTGPRLDAEKERNSTRVTTIYLVGVLVLLAVVVIISALSPLWIILTASAPTPDSRMTALIEQLKTINAIVGNIASGLLTALGIGIGYFFRRSSAKD